MRRYTLRKCSSREYQEKASQFQKLFMQMPFRDSSCQTYLRSKLLKR